MKTLKFFCFTLLILVIAKEAATAQTIIYSTNFGTTVNVNPPNWIFTGLNMNVSTHPPRSTGYTGASGQCYMAEGNSVDFTNTFGTFLTNSLPGISTATLVVITTGYPGVTVSFGMRKSAGYDSEVVYSLEWSNDGLSYTPVIFTEPPAGTWGLASGSGLNLPAGAGNQPALYLKWTFDRTGPNYGLNFRLDDVTVTGTASACTSPAIISMSSNAPFCSGTDLNLNSSATGSETITYSWTGPNSFSSSSQNPTITGAGASASGIYTVTATNSCGSASATTSVTVNPLPSLAITADGPTSFCPGGSVMLMASAAANYLWSTGATTQSILVDTTGNYIVTVTDVNGCSNNNSAAPFEVTVVSDSTDINMDGITNNIDFLLLLGQFNNNCTGCREDINQDNMVNNIDFLLLLAHFNMTCQ